MLLNISLGYKAILADGNGQTAHQVNGAADVRPGQDHRLALHGCQPSRGVCIFPSHQHILGRACEQRPNAIRVG